MNYQDPLTQSDVLIMIGAYLGTALFSLGFQFILKAWLDHTANSNTYKKEWLEEYSTWSPQKRSDFIFMINNQVHVMIVVFLATKAVFFTW